MGDVADAVGDVFSYVGRGIGSIGSSMVEGSKKIGEALGYSKAGITPESGSTKRKRAAAFEANRPRRPANIDDAANAQMESDRLDRRRGVLANVYGGSNPTTPTVGVKTLLGQ